MRRRTIKKFSVWVVVAACLSLSSVLWAKEEFQARLLPGLGPSSQKARKLTILVESYTSTEEVFELIETFNKRGYDQFRGALCGVIKGFIRPTGGRGKKIILHAAQNIHTDKGRKILLVAESQSWSLDTTLRFNSKYPFLVIELNINNKGKGEGKVYVQADIQLTRQGTIELASYDSPPKQLFGVRVLK
jgi:hypothetical protein